MVGTVVLFVVHSWPAPDPATGEETGRIISARRATAHERRAYEEGDKRSTAKILAQPQGRAVHHVSTVLQASRLGWPAALIHSAGGGGGGFPSNQINSTNQIKKWATSRMPLASHRTK
jgi:hypothetical protein